MNEHNAALATTDPRTASKIQYYTQHLAYRHAHVNEHTYSELRTSMLDPMSPFRDTHVSIADAVSTDLFEGLQ